jgi:hypothetical protein
MGMAKHTIVQTFSTTPVVCRCSCGARVVVREQYDLERHLNRGLGGEPFPWAEPTEQA